MKIPEFVKIVLESLEKAGHEAWCVGGCVRDALLGRTADDWDVTTSALPEETLRIFDHDAIPTGLKHGTVTVRSLGRSIEVTTYRLDGAYRDHRRPESVTFTRSLEEDLRRRDFTVNAIACSVQGELRDPFGGREDLKRGILRCVGEPDRRFGEDALRILRGLRFAAVLEFAIEPSTAESIHRNKRLLREIAVERIWVELSKLLRGKAAAEVLRQYPDVLGVFWPEAVAMVGFDQKNPHHCYDVWEHSLHAMEAVPAETELRCAALLHDVGKPLCFTVDETGMGHFYGHGALSRDVADAMLRRLKCSNEFRETVVRLVEWHDREIPRTDKSIRKALRHLGEQDFRRLLKLKRADNLAQAPAYRDRVLEWDRAEEILESLLAEDACFSLKQLAVNGGDIMRLGVTGRPIGVILDALLDAVVNGEVANERAALLERAERLAEEIRGCNGRTESPK